MPILASLIFFLTYLDIYHLYLDINEHSFLCNLQIEKLKNLHRTRPFAVTYTGMIVSSMDGGHVHDCVNLFEHSKTVTAPDIGLINAMLKVYGRNDMFLKSKELFEDTLRNNLGSEIKENSHNHGLRADAFTFGCMLEASASAQQWEYFEYVYKEMALSGYQVDQRKHSALLVEASRAGKVLHIPFICIATNYYIFL